VHLESSKNIFCHRTIDPPNLQFEINLLLLTNGYQIAIIEQELCSELKARAETDFSPLQNIYCIHAFALNGFSILFLLLKNLRKSLLWISAKPSRIPENFAFLAV
jgi:hypothetical protein